MCMHCGGDAAFKASNLLECYMKGESEGTDYMHPSCSFGRYSVLGGQKLYQIVPEVLVINGLTFLMLAPRASLLATEHGVLLSRPFYSTKTSLMVSLRGSLYLCSGQEQGRRC